MVTEQKLDIFLDNSKTTSDKFGSIVRPFGALSMYGFPGDSSQYIFTAKSFKTALVSFDIETGNLKRNIKDSRAIVLMMTPCQAQKDYEFEQHEFLEQDLLTHFEKTEVQEKSKEKTERLEKTLNEISKPFSLKVAQNEDIDYLYYFYVDTGKPLLWKDELKIKLKNEKTILKTEGNVLKVGIMFTDSSSKSPLNFDLVSELPLLNMVDGPLVANKNLRDHRFLNDPDKEKLLVNPSMLCSSWISGQSCLTRMADILTKS